METLIKAIREVADKFARDNGYILVVDEVKYLHKDTFWGNAAIGTKYAMDHDFKKFITYKSFKYVYPLSEEEKDSKKSTPKIELDMYWGDPRITVLTKDESGSFCLTYSSKTRKFSSAQVWEEKGFERALDMKNAIEQKLVELVKDK